MSDKRTTKKSPVMVHVAGPSALAGPAEIVREPADPKLLETLADLSAILRKMVDKSWTTHLECARYGSLPGDVALAPLALHRHCMEAAEGIAALCMSLGSTPAAIVLRSQYEGWLSLSYLLEAEVHVRDRAFAWFVGDKLDSLKSIERMDKSKASGKTFAAMLKRDRFGPSARRHPQPSVRSLAAKLKAELEQPALGSTVELYRRAGEPNRHVEWYSLRGGPKNLAELAAHLSVSATHLELYGGWSSTAHARDSTQLLVRTPKGGTVLRPINDPREIPGIVGLSLRLLLDCSRLMLLRMRSGNESNLARWYKTEVHARITSLERIRIESELSSVH